MGASIDHLHLRFHNRTDSNKLIKANKKRLLPSAVGVGNGRPSYIRSASFSQKIIPPTRWPIENGEQYVEWSVNLRLNYYQLNNNYAHLEPVDNDNGPGAVDRSIIISTVLNLELL